MTTINQQDVRNAIASVWWIPLVQGIAAILFGMYAFNQTGQTLAAIIVILGIYWVINGLFSVVAAITGKTERSRMWELVGGVLSIIAGLLAISQPLLTGLFSASFLGTLIGISAIISGVIQMFAGREVMEGAGREWSLGSFLLGLLNLILGLIILGSPALTFIVFVRIMALWVIIGGLGLIAAAFRIRSISN